jgi:hypothetical protein
MKTQFNHLVPINTDPRYSKALHSQVDYERLYFAFRSDDIIQNTLRQTTQSKATIHYPMRHYLKRRFQLLRHKRLNELINTDTFLQVTSS